MDKRTEHILRTLAEGLQTKTMYDSYEGKMEGAIREAIDESLWNVGDMLNEVLEDTEEHNSKDK